MIEVAGQTLLTMRTPGDDRALAIGFLLSEGVATTIDDIVGVDLRPGDASAQRADTISVAVRGAAATAARGRLTRTHEIRPSCGICGMTDADALLEELPPVLPGVPRLRRAAIDDLLRRFEGLQPHFRATGACHGAAIFGADGSLWGSGEDVGRHNALDKAIGTASLAGHDLAQGIALLSGRAGFDLVLKCLRRRVPVILSVSAASALSFDLCKASGATLVGFLRPHRMIVYCDSGRLID